MTKEIEKNMKQKIKAILNTTKFWVIVCAIGIWAQFLYTILSSEVGIQTVYVTGGTIDYVEGRVGVKGTVDVEGTVDVSNTVDINVAAINGYRNCFYNNLAKHPNQYYRIPIADY